MVSLTFLITIEILSLFSFFWVAIKTLKPALEMYSRFAKSIINESNLPISESISFSRSYEVMVSIRPSTDNVNSF